MAKRCEVCGKGPQFGNNVSHANNRISRELRTPLNSINGAIFYLQQFESAASENQRRRIA